MKFILILFVLFSGLIWSQDIQFIEHFVDDEFDGPAGIFLADINGDQRKDIISAAVGSGEISWWQNEEGIQDNWLKHDIGQQAGAIYVFVEDINSDSFADVAVAAWNSHTLGWWENQNGNGLNWIYHEVDNSFHQAHEIYAADVDNDGFMDILGAAAQDDEIAWWKNLDGSGENWDKQVIATDFAGARSIDVVDFNQDGFLEVVGAALTDNEVSWWQYDQANDLWQKTLITSNLTAAHKVVVCQMNDDDFPDLLVTAFADGIYWFANDGSYPPEFNMYPVDPAFNGAVIAYPADFDDDGYMDVAGSSQGQSTIAWWKNSGGTAFNWTYHQINPFFDNVWPLHVGDIDNDGDIDIAAGGNVADEIRWWENTDLIADFEAEPRTGNAPKDIFFIDQSTGDIDSWAWDFQNDGVIDSNQPDPAFTYDSPGIYSVNLEITSGSETASILKEDFVHIFNGHCALEFKSEDDYVHVPCSTVPNLEGSFTIEAWIFPYSFGADPLYGLGRIFDKMSVSVFLSEQFALYMDQSLVIEMMHTDGTVSRSTTPAHSITLDQWQHVAVSYDGVSQVKMFVNGFQMMSHQPVEPTGELSSNQASDIVFGNNADLNKTFDGLIDEIRIWSDFKNQYQIQENMHNFLNGNETNLVHYWRWNEGCGDYVFDETDNTMGIVEMAEWRQGIELEPAAINNNLIPLADLSLANFPNPFNPSTTIAFQLNTETTENTELVIYNLKGQKIRTLDYHAKPFTKISTGSIEGLGKVVWNGTDDNNIPVGSGIYFVRLKIEGVELTRKMLLLK